MERGCGGGNVYVMSGVVWPLSGGAGVGWGPPPASHQPLHQHQSIVLTDCQEQLLSPPYLRPPTSYLAKHRREVTVNKVFRHPPSLLPAPSTLHYIVYISSY